MWTGATLSKAHKIHEKPVDSIFVSGTQHVLTGGKDNKISVL